MELTAEGWRRYVSTHYLGRPNLETPIVRVGKPSSYGRRDTYLEKYGSDVTISWMAVLRFTGDYLMQLKLSKAEIATLFRESFGEFVSLQDLESVGLQLTNEGLRTKITGMAVGELLELLQQKPGENPQAKAEE